MPVSKLRTFLVPALFAAILQLHATAVCHASLTIAGTNAGIFTNPSPGTATTTGVGTNNFTWGIGVPAPPSSLNFAAVTPISTTSETDFKLGTLTYYNGTILNGADSVDFKETINFTDPAVGAKSFTFELELINTPNDSTPTANADFVNFPSSFSNTTFTFASVTYTLKILGFQNVVGDGHLTSNVNQFHVRENKSASAELWGRVTTELPPIVVNGVPEPSTIWVAMSAAVVGLGCGWRRRLRVAA